MRRKTIVSLIVVLVVSFAGISTASAEEMENPTMNSSTDLALTARYLGETVLHTGATVGVEYYLYENSWYKLMLAPNIGWYFHPRNHHAALVDVELGGRFTSNFGLFADGFLGLGYFHRFPDGEIFEVSNSGNVDEDTNSGIPAGMGIVTVGGGWDFSKNNIAPLNLHLRLGGIFEYPFNNTVLPHGIVQLGLTYRF